MVRATFSGLEIGKSALTLSQLGLDVTGHNIANVDTNGYTRQRIISTAYDPFATIGKALPASQALIGSGVKVLIHDQIRSAYLDNRYRTVNSINSYWQKRTENLTYLESFFDNVNEETSINYSIANFFGAVKVLAEDSVEGAPRKLLQTAGLDLVQQLNSIYEGLIDLQETQNLAVKVTVEEINRIATDIVELNKAIYGFEVTGNIALDLRDKRNLLLDDLSAIIPIDYREYPDGRGQTVLEVKIGGEILVDHDKQFELAVRETANAIPGEDPVWEVIWKSREILDTDPGAEYNVYLYKGSDKNHPISFSVDMTDRTQVADAVRKLNDLAKQFNRLNVLYDSVNGIAPTISTAPTAPDLADYDNDPDNKDYKAALAAYNKALAAYNASQADYNSAVSIINQMCGYFDPADFPLSIDCDEGGHHAVITLDGLVFSRSAGCVDSNKISYCLDFYPPTIAGAEEPLLITGGELKAYIDMRDSYDVHTPGIPYYIEMLNNLARALVLEINAVHRAGYTEDIVRPAFLGLPDGSIQGVDFFGAKDKDGNYISLDTFLNDPGYLADLAGLDAEVNSLIDDMILDSSHASWAETVMDPFDDTDPDYTDKRDALYGELFNAKFAQLYNANYSGYITLVTAKNICLSEAVQNSEFNIACSTNLIVKHGDPDKLQSGNNENSNLLYELFLRKDIAIIGGADVGSFDGFATSIRFDVANTLSFAKKTAENNAILTLAADNQRIAISGVSLDEEMTNLIKYQHSYNGAARVITAMDEALDKLINGTGRVGL